MFQWLVMMKVKPNVEPKFCKARSVLFIKSKVEAELADLQSKCISHLLNTTWAVPIVPILNREWLWSGVWLRGDCKLINYHATPIETYTLPSIEELLAAMSGRKYFSKLDLQNAYLRLPLDTASKQYVAINIHHSSLL